uniref:Peripheral subunit-binding (PSBD) domain-containing protein n=1 Tax=Lactuca sativa TaxID=4236 RepID=A0A9R1VXY6_LACSA|nr:hypothetical protein LSAT_V11C400164060 [Lactuca sativa]
MIIKGNDLLYNVKGHYFSSNAEDSQHAGGIIDHKLVKVLQNVNSSNGLSKILHAPGDIIKVGETLLQLVVEDSAVPFNDSDASVVSDGSKFDEHKLELRKSHANDNLSTPVVRSLAKQHGIDLADVTGSGKHGRILKEDVLKYGVEKGIVDDKPAFNPTSIEPMSGPEEQLQEMVESLYHDKIFSQRAYQRAMVRSMTTAASVPHFHYVEEINCDGLMKLKSTFQKENTDLDIKFTFLPMLINSLSSVHLCCKLIF